MKGFDDDERSTAQDNIRTGKAYRFNAGLPEILQRTEYQ